ncbi:MAG: DUF523 domain-containing protein [Velocimicrobium sp.]
MNVLISACLLGVNCRYSGDGKQIKEADELKVKYNLIPICPEIFGGMATPREPSEKRNGGVFSKMGEDVTDYFARGAQEVLRLANFFECKYAILKERSPSCGYGEIYDGTFSNVIIEGNGVLAELLEQNGIIILGESQIKQLLI